MGRFTQHNMAVIQKAAKRPSTERMFDKEMGESLSAIADYVMEMMEEQIPFDTGNLHDSTGIGIYVNGVLTAFRYQRAANVNRDGKWGYMELNRAFAAGAMQYSSGVWLVAFSTMPYAAKIDELTEYFSEGFRDELKDLVTNEFKLR